MRQFIIITLTAIAMLVQTGTTQLSHAGSRDRHILQGVIIGTGAALLGAAIASEIHDSKASAHVYVRGGINGDAHRHYSGKRHRKHGRHHHCNHHCRHERKGHWRIEKVWIDPVYETRWNPGHYNKKGRWVSGRYQEVIIRDGYWTKKKVWVSRR